MAQIPSTTCFDDESCLHNKGSLCVHAVNWHRSSHLKLSLIVQGWDFRMIRYMTQWSAFFGSLFYAFLVTRPNTMDDRVTSRWWWWTDEDKHPCLQRNLNPWSQHSGDQGLRLTPRAHWDQPTHISCWDTFSTEKSQRDVYISFDSIIQRICNHQKKCTLKLCNKWWETGSVHDKKKLCQ